jgi:hypothetical protein
MFMFKCFLINFCEGNLILYFCYQVTFQTFPVYNFKVYFILFFSIVVGLFLISKKEKKLFQFREKLQVSIS